MRMSVGASVGRRKNEENEIQEGDAAILRSYHALRFLQFVHIPGRSTRV